MRANSAGRGGPHTGEGNSWEGAIPLKLCVVTSNPHKAEEIRSYFQDLVDIEHISIECPEYRHDDVGEIARNKRLHMLFHR